MGSRLYALLALCFTSGCVLATPFRGPAYSYWDGIASEARGAGDTVVIALTFARLGEDDRRNEAFRSNLGPVVESLDAQPGLIGYSIRKAVFGKDFWTMTVWKDEASLDAFVMGRRHSRAMMEGSTAPSESRFARVQVPADRAPLDWDNALEILAAHGASEMPSLVRLDDELRPAQRRSSSSSSGM